MTASMPGAVYSSLAARAAANAPEVYPLHVGDTWMEPAEGCRMEDLTLADYPGLNHYTPVRGLPALLDAVVERTRERTGVATERDEVLITAGATCGLANVAGALLNSGDEVLLAAPFWPLIAGIVRLFGGKPVPVPLMEVSPTEGAREIDTPEAAVAAVEAARTERTVALYYGSPNNPTGRAIPATWIDAMVSWARDQDLWLWADEVYEDYVFDTAPDASQPYTRPRAPERTISVHSFSKAYGMAGNRCGYLVGPREVIAEATKVGTHSAYCAPHASQMAALQALDRGDAWVEEARRRYAELGRAAAQRLGVAPPDGSTFLFVDVSEQVEEAGDLGPFLERCADRGLLVAPGPSFGPYPHHVRLCFTSAEPRRVRAGVEVLASLLER